MTNGWVRLTSGWHRSGKVRLAGALLAFAAIAILQAIVNALSLIDERTSSGEPVPAWEIWTWELTSMVSWILLAPAIFVAVRRLRPPRFTLLAALGAHLAASVIVSLIHVVLMQAVRMYVYRLAGSEYGGTISGAFLYEYRKDLVTYVLVVIFYLLFERVTRPAPTDTESFRIEVRDGSRVHWVAPNEVDWAQAAGNYVELHGAFGSVLHRQTLTALEQTLALHGFVRVQRSRIVRKQAVAGIETRPSGDFDIIMASGERLGGSRRYRANL